MVDDAKNESKDLVSLGQVGESLGLQPRVIGPIMVRLGYRTLKGSPTAVAIGLGLAPDWGVSTIPGIVKWHRHKTINALLSAGIAPGNANAVREELITWALLNNYQERTHWSKARVARFSSLAERRRFDCIVTINQIEPPKEALLLMDRVLRALEQAGMSTQHIDSDVTHLPIRRQDVEAYRISLNTDSSSLSYLSHRLTHRKETNIFEISVRLINARKSPPITHPNFDFHGNRKRRKVNVTAHSPSSTRSAFDCAI